MKLDDTQLLELFSSAYIIGGSPCSGKSTITERLSQEFKFNTFKVDDHLEDYGNQATEIAKPVMYQFSQLSWNEIWSRPLEVQVSEEILYFQEMFSLVLADLQKIVPNRSCIMEGAAFLPELLHLWPVNPNRVLFMVPTLDFQISHYRNRAWIQPILQSCKDPDFAFSQWMKRDELFGKEIIRQANRYDYQVIEVDGSIAVDDLYQLIKCKLNLC